MARARIVRVGEDGQELPELGFIPADPEDARLTVEGAVCSSDGKIDVESYQDLAAAFAGEPRPERHVFPEKPGVRSGEFVPKGLRTWDDVHAGSSNKDGAGWIAVRSSKRDGKKEKWFNIRTCGSWRMAFLLARLQRAIWEHGGRTQAADIKLAAVATPEVTPVKKRPAPDSSATTAKKRAKQGGSLQTPEKPSQPEDKGAQSVEDAGTASKVAAEQPQEEKESKLNTVLARIRARMQEGAAKEEAK
mmetsp:Transcript_12769/g.28205  ORF Transcript_12769/g.28205 Transcript_12769/m.28205 type:complete len:247 (+) Transcript_12769:21-761(+)|eukprot:CAMPEP_0170615848 /NCGR_PEP_ID=MMETSP0224-20130122/25559_1 /TAXON_ID=285029 /ORGANISM="Togula jolla, Strain CCCM 725" /LENGTH=246 /DNA_ID=CAMNT_0010941613 /DNA_START=21 /DNA_END=761 /DNA_ORIENTATION=+